MKIIPEICRGCKNFRSEPVVVNGETRSWVHRCRKSDTWSMRDVPVRRALCHRWDDMETARRLREL